MRTLVTGTSNKRRPARTDNPGAQPGFGNRGFTLIEVLVVVVIVGIISAVVLLSVNLVRNDRDLQQEAKRLASLIELSADEALFLGRDLGIEFMTNGYRFVEFDPYLDQWNEMTGDDFLRPRALPEQLRLEVSIEDRRVLLKDEAVAISGGKAGDRGKREPGYAPHVLVLSSGEITPFQLLVLRDADRREYTVTVTPEGNIELEDDADDER